MINSSLLDIYVNQIVTTENNTVIVEGEYVRNDNLTWSVNSFEGHLLEIQITFSDAVMFSPHFHRDKLNVRLLNGSYSS